MAEEKQTRKQTGEEKKKRQKDYLKATTGLSGGIGLPVGAFLLGRKYNKKVLEEYLSKHDDFLLEFPEINERDIKEIFQKLNPKNKLQMHIIAEPDYNLNKYEKLFPAYSSSKKAIKRYLQSVSPHYKDRWEELKNAPEYAHFIYAKTIYDKGNAKHKLDFIPTIHEAGHASVNVSSPLVLNGLQLLGWGGHLASFASGLFTGKEYNRIKRELKSKLKQLETENAITNDRIKELENELENVRQARKKALKKDLITKGILSGIGSTSMVTNEALANYKGGKILEELIKQKQLLPEQISKLKSRWKHLKGMNMRNYISTNAALVGMNLGTSLLADAIRRYQILNKEKKIQKLKEQLKQKEE